MASQMPTAIQNENLHIPRGKGDARPKAEVLKPEKKNHKDRKALADLSKVEKASSLKPSAVSLLKEKSAAHGHENTKNTSKSFVWTDDEIKQCSEWAKGGIEHVHFSGNDLNALQKDIDEKRVRKKVEKVMAAFSGWTHMAYCREKPTKEIREFSEEFIKLELESEVLPSDHSPSISDNEGADDLFYKQEYFLWPCPDIKSKEEYWDDFSHEMVISQVSMHLMDGMDSTSE